MNPVQAVILGIIQGLTEWLPISSSGHLVITQKLLNITTTHSFDIAIHLGTLLVVIIYFWKDLVKILKALINWETKSYEFKLLKYITLTTIITGIFGIFFYDKITRAFYNLTLVSTLLVINGIFLIYVNKKKGPKKINTKSTIGIAIAQTLALLPGISRSGSTIGTGLLTGLKKEEAFKFSFLLSIPAIIGANLYIIPKENFIITSNVLIGIATSFIFGYIAIIWLKKWLLQNKLNYFGYYCILIGILLLIL